MDWARTKSTMPSCKVCRASSWGKRKAAKAVMPRGARLRRFFNCWTKCTRTGSSAQSGLPQRWWMLQLPQPTSASSPKVQYAVPLSAVLFVSYDLYHTQQHNTIPICPPHGIGSGNALSQHFHCGPLHAYRFSVLCTAAIYKKRKNM